LTTILLLCQELSRVVEFKHIEIVKPSICENSQKSMLQTAVVITQPYTENGVRKSSPWFVVVAEVRFLRSVVWYDAKIMNRIRALGIGSVMGVPGDMNLELLDYINDVDGLNWSKSTF
jgi:hypothetical protein